MNSFNYKNDFGKIYYNFSNGSALKALSVKDIHFTNMFRFCRNVFGVASYTKAVDQAEYIIGETQQGYSIKITWLSTKLKSETINQYLSDLKAGIPIPANQSEWRTSILYDLDILVTICSSIAFTCENIGRQYQASLFAEIELAQLIEQEKDKTKEIVPFKSEPTEFSVPLELIVDTVIDKYKEAYKHFGVNHTELIEQLKPLEGKDFLADFLLGFTYFVYLKKPDLAYEYFKRASKMVYEIHSELVPHLLNFMGDIEFSIKNDIKASEQSYVNSLLWGNESGFLNLAYLYLQQALVEKKTTALNLVRIGEKILENEPNKLRRIAGYHIVASVYIWNKQFEDAARTQYYFLSSSKFCNSYPDQIESYLVMVFSVNDFDFTSNLIVEYPVILKDFSLHVDTWKFGVLDPRDPRFTKQMMPFMQKINLARHIYRLYP